MSSLVGKLAWLLCWTMFEKLFCYDYLNNRVSVNIHLFGFSCMQILKVRGCTCLTVGTVWVQSLKVRNSGVRVGFFRENIIRNVYNWLNYEFYKYVYIREIPSFIEICMFSLKRDIQEMWTFVTEIAHLMSMYGDWWWNSICHRITSIWLYVYLCSSFTHFSFSPCKSAKLPSRMFLKVHVLARTKWEMLWFISVAVKNSLSQLFYKYNIISINVFHYGHMG